MLPRSMKGEVRFFWYEFSISRFCKSITLLCIGKEEFEIFLVGSRPTLSEIFLIGSQPNMPGLASYLTSFSVPTGRDDGLPNLLCSTPSCATSRFCLEVTLRAG